MLCVCCVLLLVLAGGIRSKGDGLSVNRLTLLGRVHMARVVVDSLNLESVSVVDTVPVRDRQHRGPRGKPPTPTRTAERNKRCQFMCCYQIYAVRKFSHQIVFYDSY